MTKPIPFDVRFVKPEVVKKLLNRELVGKVYSCNSIKGAAAILGTSAETLRRVLPYHGYETRKRGEKPKGTIIETKEEQVTIKENERAAELRRYYEDEDAGCPPRCPGLDYCYSARGCVLKELVGAK